MKTIYLARHAQTESNAGTKLSVNKEVALTELGHAQAVELADWVMENVGDINDIFISHYIRTHQTALPLLDKLNKSPIVIYDLHEFNYLNFANIKDIDLTNIGLIKEIADKYWQKFNPDDIDGIELNTPDDWQAESFANFVGRVNKAIDYFKNLPDGTYMVYTHGLWLSMLVWVALNQPTHNNLSMQKFRQFELSIRPKNCEVYCLKFIDDMLAMKKVRVLKDGDTNIAI